MDAGRGTDAASQERGGGELLTTTPRLALGLHGTAAEGAVNLILLLLVALLILSLPTWPYSAAWGYYPSGGFGIIVLILLVLLLTRRRV